MTTAPAATGTSSTRPATGASTVPSAVCCSKTRRCAFVASIWPKQHVNLRAQRIETLRRGDPAGKQVFATFQFGLRIGQLCALRFKLGVNCQNLKPQFVINDLRQHLPGGHQITFGHRK